MICFLKGIIEDIGTDNLAMDVNGVGYEVFCSARTLAKVAVGEEVKIFTHTHVREDAFTLFGFAEKTEKDIFETLINVNGVGAKVGLAILSALSPSEVVDAISLQDGKMMARANGVGPKLGERIVRELKDKIGALSGSVNLPTDFSSGSDILPESGNAVGDVLSALVNLGYKQPQAHSAITLAAKEKDGIENDFDKLFKASLAELR